MQAVLFNILVATGTGLDFSRLVHKMDELTPHLGARVVIQIGNAKYEPQHAESFRFADSLRDYIRNADLVVSHGAMIAIEAIQAGKSVIVVPRQARYKEHIDDHQVEFAQCIARHPAVEVVYDVNRLEEAIGRARHKAHILEFDDSNRLRLLDTLREFVQTIQAHSQ
jgi:UDP-N-acetylglucosamine transferase subunit ALG13